MEEIEKICEEGRERGKSMCESEREERKREREKDERVREGNVCLCKRRERGN